MRRRQRAAFHLAGGGALGLSGLPTETPFCSAFVVCRRRLISFSFEALNTAEERDTAAVGGLALSSSPASSSASHRYSHHSQRIISHFAPPPLLRYCHGGWGGRGGGGRSISSTVLAVHAGAPPPSSTVLPPLSSTSPMCSPTHAVWLQQREALAAMGRYAASVGPLRHGSSGAAGMGMGMGMRGGGSIGRYHDGASRSRGRQSLQRFPASGLQRFTNRNHSSFSPLIASTPQLNSSFSPSSPSSGRQLISLRDIVLDVCHYVHQKQRHDDEAAEEGGGDGDEGSTVAMRGRGGGQFGASHHCSCRSSPSPGADAADTKNGGGIIICDACTVVAEAMGYSRQYLAHVAVSTASARSSKRHSGGGSSSRGSSPNASCCDSSPLVDLITRHVIGIPPMVLPMMMPQRHGGGGGGGGEKDQQLHAQQFYWVGSASAAPTTTSWAPSADGGDVRLDTCMNSDWCPPVAVVKEALSSGFLSPSSSERSRHQEDGNDDDEEDTDTETGAVRHYVYCSHPLTTTMGSGVDADAVVREAEDGPPSSNPCTNNRAPSRHWLPLEAYAAHVVLGVVSPVAGGAGAMLQQRDNSAVTKGGSAHSDAVTSYSRALGEYLTALAKAHRQEAVGPSCSRTSPRRRSCCWWVPAGEVPSGVAPPLTQTVAALPSSPAHLSLSVPMPFYHVSDARRVFDRVRARAAEVVALARPPPPPPSSGDTGTDAADLHHLLIPKWALDSDHGSMISTTTTTAALHYNALTGEALSFVPCVAAGAHDDGELGEGGGDDVPPPPPRRVLGTDRQWAYALGASELLGGQGLDERRDTCWVPLSYVVGGAHHRPNPHHHQHKKEQQLLHRHRHHLLPLALQHDDVAAVTLYRNHTMLCVDGHDEERMKHILLLLLRHKGNAASSLSSLSSLARGFVLFLREVLSHQINVVRSDQSDGGSADEEEGADEGDSGDGDGDGACWLLLPRCTAPSTPSAPPQLPSSRPSHLLSAISSLPFEWRRVPHSRDANVLCNFGAMPPHSVGAMLSAPRPDERRGGQKGQHPQMVLPPFVASTSTTAPSSTTTATSTTCAAAALSLSVPLLVPHSLLSTLMGHYVSLQEIGPDGGAASVGDGGEGCSQQAEDVSVPSSSMDPLPLAPPPLAWSSAVLPVTAASNGGSAEESGDDDEPLLPPVDDLLLDKQLFAPPLPAANVSPAAILRRNLLPPSSSASLTLERVRKEKERLRRAQRATAAVFPLVEADADAEDAAASNTGGEEFDGSTLPAAAVSITQQTTVPTPSTTFATAHDGHGLYVLEVAEPIRCVNAVHLRVAKS